MLNASFVTDLTDPPVGETRIDPAMAVCDKIVKFPSLIVTCRDASCADTDPLPDTEGTPFGHARSATCSADLGFRAMTQLLGTDVVCVCAAHMVCIVRCAALSATRPSRSSCS